MDYQYFKPFPLAQLRRVEEARALIIKQKGGLGKLPVRAAEEESSETDNCIENERLNGPSDNLDKIKVSDEVEDMFASSEEEDDLPSALLGPWPYKKAKIERDLNFELINCTDLMNVWKSFQLPEGGLLDTKIDENALNSLMKLAIVQKITNTDALRSFTVLIVKSIIQLKVHRNVEQYLTQFVELYPKMCLIIVSEIAKDADFIDLFISLVNLDRMIEFEEKEVFLVWLQKFSIETSNIELPQLLLDRNPDFTTDREIVTWLLRSCQISNSHKCVKFSKLLLKIVNQADRLTEEQLSLARAVVASNKSFMRVKLQAQLDKKP